METIIEIKYIRKNRFNKKAKQVFNKGDHVIIKEDGIPINAIVVSQINGGYKTIITANNGKTHFEVLTKKLKK